MEEKQENNYYKVDDNPSSISNIIPLNIEMPLNDNGKNEKNNKSLYIKIFIAIIYFGLIIGIEQAYRENLFNKSIDAQEDIKKIMIKEVLFMSFGTLYHILVLLE